jgi:hypothetical protein
LLAGLLNYSSTLKMEAIRSSETSSATQRTIRRHIPEDDTLKVNNSYVKCYLFNTKIHEIRSSETSGATQRTIRRHIPEDDTLKVNNSYVKCYLFNIKIHEIPYMFRASSCHHQRFYNSMEKYFTYVLHRDFSPLQLKFNYVRLSEKLLETWRLLLRVWRRACAVCCQSGAVQMFTNWKPCSDIVGFHVNAL